MSKLAICVVIGVNWSDQRNHGIPSSEMQGRTWC